MAWFRFTNNAGVPVHIAVSTAGVIQFCRNDVSARGGYEEWHCQDGMWHDLTVIPSNGTNQIDVKKNNDFKIAEIVTGSVSALLAAASVPIAIVSGGSGAVLVVGATSTAAGVLATLTDIAIVAADAIMHPATIGNLYGPHGYNFTIGGGEISGVIDPATNKFHVTRFQPIHVQWHNNTTGNNGTVNPTT